MEQELLLRLAQTGDLAGLERLVGQGMLDSATDGERNLLTRAAAQAGQADFLRALFEQYHLYAVDTDNQGRTPLHFAAMSGDRETARFAMDVLGFDPLTGDASGKTALDYAKEADKQEAYRFFTERLGFGLEGCYRNPILRGFHPDPSIVRVGEDYYLVNSSFVLFPGLPISHSKDLVHWQVVGHGVENLEWSGLEGLPGGFGYWAPDISWFKGRFWVTATLRRSTPPYRLQMITSAADPRGPWDKPKFLTLDGIDPSIFTDSDGRRYILLNPGAIIAEISEAGDVISPPRMLSFGDARIKPEGPHLLKKDGRYYLFLAEGGTGFGHMETVLRSRDLMGPYEACPFNPILGKKNAYSLIQRSGHGKPVMTPDGDWYMVYLCGRPVEGKTVLGRETALDPITWTADGWPMVNRLKGPSCLQKLPPMATDAALTRNDEWIAPRTDPRDFAVISQDCVSLRCGADPAGIGPCSVLLRRQTEAAFTQRVRVDAADTAEGSLCGLAGYYDERSFFVFGVAKQQDAYALKLLEQIGDERQTTDLGPLPGPVCELSLKAEGLDRHLFITENGQDKALLTFRAEYLSDEGVQGGKRFTGALEGIAALGHGTVKFFQFHDAMYEMNLSRSNHHD